MNFIEKFINYSENFSRWNFWRHCFVIVLSLSLFELHIISIQHMTAHFSLIVKYLIKTYFFVSSSIRTTENYLINFLVNFLVNFSRKWSCLQLDYLYMMQYEYSCFVSVWSRRLYFHKKSLEELCYYYTIINNPRNEELFTKQYKAGNITHNKSLTFVYCVGLYGGRSQHFHLNIFYSVKKR